VLRRIWSHQRRKSLIRPTDGTASRLEIVEAIASPTRVARLAVAWKLSRRPIASRPPSLRAKRRQSARSQSPSRRRNQGARALAAREILNRERISGKEMLR